MRSNNLNIEFTPYSKEFYGTGSFQIEFCGTSISIVVELLKKKPSCKSETLSGGILLPFFVHLLAFLMNFIKLSQNCLCKWLIFVKSKNSILRKYNKQGNGCFGLVSFARSFGSGWCYFLLDKLCIHNATEKNLKNLLNLGKSFEVVSYHFKMDFSKDH